MGEARRCVIEVMWVSSGYLRSLVPRRRERGTCDRDRRVTHVAPCERSPRTEIENIAFQNICQLWALIIEVAKDDFVHLAGNSYLLNASV